MVLLAFPKFIHLRQFDFDRLPVEKLQIVQPDEFDARLGVYPIFSHTNILNFENAVAAAPSKLQRSRSFGHFPTAHFFRSRRKMILLETL